MKKALLDILACPVCKHHPLSLKAKKEEGEEIVEGDLHCSGCGASYVINDGIPDMLPPERS